MNHEVTFLPTGKKTVIRAGTTVLEAARKAGVHIPTRCAGKASCLMCKITINSEDSGISMPTTAEEYKLGPLLASGTRLSCQARVMGKAAVIVPEDPLKAAVRRQLERQAEEDLW
ncbi:2Fe-2S iron-sulfur cluster-binding protein [Paenibacillus sp. P96]|uniref:2Fe-2S iron-sulfur cluster-binding protein n=1 Tax=Paenibacillus zeirhizosphaerae TaxID=2987519 RepID=A0ABT9FPK1_9BACL|nr:2Fe-2S iron-sulfur cluster-binding protein [Paenibacillus sp. P96]MDP4096661.1 2Fe-2S iron-sulfur cluster-binding protein [Paenibacillus sp. P96]